MTRDERADDAVDAIVRIGLDNGGPEGENSAYLLPDRGVVVDPGPPTEGAWERLTEGVASAGLSIGDVDWVLVSHWHADHAGLAPRLADAAEAQIAMHELDAPLVADYAVERERRIERDARRLREWGVPDAIVDALRSGDRPSPMPDVTRVRELSDGEAVAGVEAIHTPGHTLGHAAFVVRDWRGDAEADDASDESNESDESDRVPILVGDHVLPSITPNVGGGDTRLWGGGRADSGSPSRSPLATYVASLGRVQELVGDPDPDRRPRAAYPGHGSSLELAERIEAIRAHHEQRRQRVRAVAAGSSHPVTPWDVADELFGEMSGIHAKMGAGEAASHLAWLRERGSIDRVESDPVRYRVADEED